MVFRADLPQMFIHADIVVKIVLLVLIVFSLISWAIIFMKWRYFRNAGHETNYFHDIFWDTTTELGKLYKECNDLTFSPVAQLYRAGYSEIVRMRKSLISSTKESEPDVNGLSQHVERALRRTAIQQGSKMEKTLSFLATTGNTAPFIGLFGTVWGIMASFREIGMQGSASLTVVAPGISEALIATAVGLFAAIPAVIAFNYFSNKVSELQSEMDTFSADFLSLVVRQVLKRSKGS